MAKKKKALTKKQLDILYECWKEADNYKDRLALIEKKLSEIPPLVALGIMRKMAKTDTKWVKMATRKKNQEAKEKLEKKKAREKNEKNKEAKRIEREKKREEKGKIEKNKTKMNRIKKSFKKEHMEKLKELVEPEFFFCGALQHFVSNICCIYRTFSKEDGFILDSQCEKCLKMNKYISIIEEIITDARKEIRGDSATKGRRKNEKQTKKRAGRKKKNS